MMMIYIYILSIYVFAFRCRICGGNPDMEQGAGAVGMVCGKIDFSRDTQRRMAMTGNR